MPQSCTRIYGHLIFSTKNRASFLDETRRPRVHQHVKRESSKFVKTLGNQYSKFYWQRGYGLTAGVRT